MLILTRRVGETVMIGNDVTVSVLGVKGNQVRIGINAPKNVPVHREEIFKRIQDEVDAGLREPNDWSDHRKQQNGNVADEVLDVKTDSSVPRTRHRQAADHD